MTAGDRRPGSRFDDVADAAARAFELLPSTPQDVRPRPGRDHEGRHTGSAPTPTRSSGT